MRNVISLIIILLLVSSVSAQDEPPDPTLSAAQATGKVRAPVMSGMQATGTTRVIVQLEEPVSGSAALSARKTAIAQAQNNVLAAAASTPGLKVGFQYQTVAAFSAELTNTAALNALAQHPRVKSIEPDADVRGFLGEGVPAIDADDVHNLGITGASTTIAVLDSGVDTDHPDIADDLIAQKCYNGDGDCEPGDVIESNSAEDENGHGTHVTGIVTSGGLVAPRGFAPDADIVAVRVLNSGNTGFISDIVAGLDWLNANYDTTPVHIVNLSLGGGLFSGVCDDTYTTLYQAIQNLVDRDVVVFAASGNSGDSTSISAPACFSNVIAVGATYDSTSYTSPCSGSSALLPLACFTNTSSELSILAPGSPITSSGLDGGFTTKSGTSMASPAAAGVAALMLGANPTLTPASIESLLQSSGTLITDTRNDLQFPLINALAAVDLARYDRDLSASVNQLDVQYVIDRLGTTDATADVNGDGVVTPTDAVEILNQSSS